MVVMQFSVSLLARSALPSLNGNTAGAVFLPLAVSYSCVSPTQILPRAIAEIGQNKAVVGAERQLPRADAVYSMITPR
jgi:hypothetical protein